MPRIEMTETYTCGEGVFRRRQQYDVTAERADQLVGRGSARLVTASAPAPAAAEHAETGPTETADANPATPPRPVPRGKR